MNNSIYQNLFILLQKRDRKREIDMRSKDDCVEMKDHIHTHKNLLVFYSSKRMSREDELNMSAKTDNNFHNSNAQAKGQRVWER